MLLPKPWECPWFVLLHETILMSVIQDAIRPLFVYMAHVLETMLMSVVCAAAGGHVWVHGPAAMSMAPPRPLLPLKAMLMSAGWAASEDRDRAHDPYCHWRPCWVCGTCWHRRPGGYHDPCFQQIPCGGSWSVLLLTVMDKEASSAEVLMTTDSRLRKRDIESFGGNP